MGKKTKSIRVYGRLLRMLSKKASQSLYQKTGLRKHFLIPALILLIVGAAYQNCAPVNFKGRSDDNSTQNPFNDNNPIVEPPPIVIKSDINVTIPSDDIDFGNVILNTTSQPKSITITNNTPDDDVILETMTSGNIQYFTIEKGACAQALAAKASCQMTFKFSAANLDQQMAYIAIKASKKSEPDKYTAKTIKLLGKGYNDLMVDIPTNNIDFGNMTVVHTSSGPKSITITNKTPSDTVSIQINQTNGSTFGITHDCGNGIPVNGSCTVTFIFNPKDTNQSTSTVTIVAGKKNDPATPPISKSFDLTGKGATDLNVIIPTDPIDFGKVRLKTTQTKSITIQNKTPSDSVAITASLPGTDFVLDPSSSCLTQPVAKNASCELKVSFTAQVTSAKSSSLTVNAVKSSDSNSKITKAVPVLGSGLILTPSSKDQLFMVGWYSHKETKNVSYINRTTDNSLCPAVDAPADPNQDVADWQGQQKEFCFEPSGAHGLQLAASEADLDVAGKKMKDYILQNPNFQSVPTLDQLFALPSEHTSTNVPLKEALFYYALAYLNIPQKHYADPQFDVQFNVHFVDDAIGMVINNRFAGYVGIMETWGTRYIKDDVLNVEYYDYPDKDFPVSLKTGKNNLSNRGKNNTFAASPLKEGANTVIGIWLDDRAQQRNIVGARIQHKSSETAGAYQNIPVYLPNVIQGYVYDGETGTPIASATIQVTDASSGAVLKTATSDASGFYRVEGVTDGSRKVIFSKAGYVSANQSATMNHREAAGAIVEVSQGLNN